MKTELAPKMEGCNKYDGGNDDLHRGGTIFFYCPPPTATNVIMRTGDCSASAAAGAAAAAVTASDLGHTLVRDGRWNGRRERGGILGNGINK